MKTPDPEKAPVSLEDFRDLEPLLCQVLASLGYLMVDKEPGKPPKIDEEGLRALRIRLRSLPNARRKALQ